ncbi:MAG: nucleotidyl transferase AbiEii/AbiGii toxin family protein [Candidatus Omnitrophica bacterium]|nr:nucleotidyl transferase AbiEii/AbiGii toxin family protein [Candidatus Omnitrophota bacterium]
MSIAIIQNRLKSYSCRNLQEEEHALREITQEVILAGLTRTDFFKHAEFHGGTSLRIFHSTNRFSEDLDFVLNRPNANFDLETYMQSAAKELIAYGYNFEIVDRSKAASTVKKAFIKDNSIGKLLEFDYIKVNATIKKIKIKIEVDTNPPRGSECVIRYLTFPFPVSVTVHDMPTLFAGKLHALLCREYVKGRDWYDLIWYCTHKTDINFALLKSALYQTGRWKGKNLDVTREWCFRELRKKVEHLDWDVARREILPFVREYEKASLDVWGTSFFVSLIDKYLNV